MEVLVLNGNNCKNCYKCLRECHVKAIKMENEKAKIIPELCILCDRCINSCPNHAKSVIDNTDDVKTLLKTKKVVLSVAPSFIANFNVSDFETFRSAAKELGFYEAEETSIGAYYVTKQYKKDLEEHKHVNYITSSCPAVVRLIQLYYPSALKYLAQVDSPMVAHAKIIKEKYGSEVAIVFVGPCIAKKREAFESKLIDYVLTFPEINQLFEEKNIKFTSAPNPIEDAHENKARYYSVTRGIIKSFDSFVDGYEYLAADGYNAIKEILENIDQIKGVFLEMDLCDFSCVSGPCTLNSSSSGGPIKAVEIVRSYAKTKAQIDKKTYDHIDLRKNYSQIPVPLKTPTEEQTRAILARIGKSRPEDELNCRGCGYNTCREKAIAVFNNMADEEYCLPYLQAKAEDFSNLIIASSPNGIFTVDKNGTILAINDMAKTIFNLDLNNEYKHINFHDLFNLNLLDQAVASNKNVYVQKVFLEEHAKYLEVSVIYIPSHLLFVTYIKDITNDELNEQKLHQLRLNTMEVTSKVIDKQMRSVQEIASLLGETAAETKIALLKFKESLKDNED